MANSSSVMESAAGTNSLKSTIDFDKCKLKDLSKPELLREARYAATEWHDKLRRPSPPLIRLSCAASTQYQRCLTLCIKKSIDAHPCQIKPSPQQRMKEVWNGQGAPTCRMWHIAVGEGKPPGVSLHLLLPIGIGVSLHQHAFVKLAQKTGSPIGAPRISTFISGGKEDRSPCPNN